MKKANQTLALALRLAAIIMVSLTVSCSSSEDEENEPTTSGNQGSVPGVPVNLQALSGDGSVTLSWDVVDGATNYSLYSATVSGVGPDNYSELAGGSEQADIAGNSYTYNDLANETTYYFVVVASNSEGDSPASDEVSATPTSGTSSSIPDAPVNLQASPGDGRVDLTWDAASGADVYHLYMAEVSGVTASNYSELTGGVVRTGISTTSYSYSALTNGTTYYFVVVSGNSEGNSSSSAEVSATPTADTTGAVPSSPTNLQASAGDGGVALTWDAVSSANVYHLYMAEVGGVTPNNYNVLAGGMAHTDIATNYYDHTGLINGTTYYFVVIAGNSDGNSSISEEVSATPNVDTSGLAPIAPTNLQASAGDGRADLTWSAVNNADSYQLYMAEVNGVTASNYSELAGGMAYTDISANSYSVTSLTNGTTYYFAVTASNSNGSSSESNEVSATPAATNADSSELTLALDLSSSEYSSLMVTEELAEIEGQQAQGMLQEAGVKLSFANGSMVQAQTAGTSSGANFFALDDEDNVHSVFTNSGIYVLYVANDPTGEYAYVALDIDQSAEFIKLSQCALYRVELATNKVFCVERNYAPADLDSSFTASLEYQGLKPVQFFTSDDSANQATHLSGVYYLGRSFAVSGDSISWDSASNPLIRKLDIASDGSVSGASTISSDVDTIKSFTLLAGGLLVYHFSNELSAGLKLYDNGSTNVITDSSDGTNSDYFYSAGDNSDVLMYGKVGDDERIMRFMRSVGANGAISRKQLPSEMINGESTVRVIPADNGFVYALTHHEEAEELNFYQLMPFKSDPMFSIDVSSSNLAQALDNKVQLYINHVYYVATDSHPQGSYSDRDVIKIVKKRNGETRTLLNDDAWSQRYDIYKWKKVKDEIHFAGFDNSNSKMVYGRVDLTAVANNAADAEILSISEISSVLGVSSDILDLEEILPDAPNKYDAGDPKLEFYADERNPYAFTIEFTKYMNKDDVASGALIDSDSSATDHLYVWYYKTLHIVYDQDNSNAFTDYLSDGTEVSISLDEEIRDYSGYYIGNGMASDELMISYIVNPAANQAPVAVIASVDVGLAGYELSPGESLTLDAYSSYDSDGDSLTYSWSVSPSSVASLSSSSSQEVLLTVANSATGSLNVSLQVCDGANSCSSDSITLNVASIEVSAPSNLRGSADGKVVNLQWDAVDQAARYKVYRDDELLGESTYNSYVDEDDSLAYSSTYSYAVSAVSATDVESLPAPAINITTETKPILVPVADAGGDQSVTEGDIVNLDGSASSDSDGEIVSYAWELVSPDVELTIVDANQAQASFIAPAVDATTEYSLRLTVTDDDGASASNSAIVTILDASSNIVAPIADAGSDKDVTEGDVVILDGSGSFDADGDIVSYYWELISPDVELAITNADESQSSFIAPEVDADTNYIFRLSVTDNDEASASATVTISVANNVISPNADAGSDRGVTEGDSVILDGSGSFDADGDIASYYWELISPDVELAITNADESQASFIAPEVDADTNYIFRLSVTDNDEASASATVTISVANNVIEPSADAGSDRGVTEGDSVILDGSGSFDADGDIVSYYWELISPDVELAITNADESQASFIAPEVDADTNYIFRLSVTDNDEASASATVTISVANNVIEPSADAGSDRGVTEGDSVILDGSGSFDADGDIVSYYWELISPDVELAITNADESQASFIAPEVDADTNYIFRLAKM